MTRYEILIELNGVKQQLDTYKLDPISLTFNVADVADISSRNSSFSKTIRLPETRNNRLIFGDISDLGVDSSFDPNRKTKCFILVDTAVVFEGYLQLKKVFVDKELDKADYEVVVYADNDNFFKQLGNKFITDSDYSELNHYWTATNVRNSWTSEWSSGYFYPLIDYGFDWDLGEVNGWTTAYNTQVRTNNMFPATNAKYIWDKIFNDAGYTYQSEFLNSQVFTSLYIPFNREKLLRSNTSTEGRFSIGRTQSASFSSWTQSRVDPDTIIDNDPFYGPIAVANSVNNLIGTFSIPFNSEASPNGDPDNLYNTTTYLYTAPANFIAQRFVCNFDITFRFKVEFPAFASGFGGAYATSICFKRSRNPVTGVTVSGGYLIPVNGSIAARPFTPGAIAGIQYEAAGGTNAEPQRCYGQISTDVLDGSTVNQKKLFAGEKVWVEIRYSANNIDIRAKVGNGNLLPPIETIAFVNYNTRLPIGTACGTFSGNNKFFNILNTNVLVDEEIDYNQVLPLNVKQSDFIVSIIKMFNLYIEPSKQYENQLVIEPRDAYYAAGVIKDWTSKLNIDEDVEEQILGDTQNKKTIWKYKDDKDYYNEDYKNNRGGLSYGEFNFYSSNEFVSGEKKVEITFSPTPLAPIMNPNNGGQTSLIIPKIAKLNNNLFERTESNIRILTKFNSSTDLSWVYGDYQFFSDASQWNAYTVLTSNGFGNALHSFKVGDYVNVNQSDGGALKPMLQGNFKIVAIRDTKSIIINIPFSSVGSGVAVGGTVTPLDGLLPVATDNDTWQFEGVKYKAYPYLGHFNNPQEPAYDINFGQTNGLYYMEETVTNDNLYSVYWENFINELFDKDSRIITASFYLSPFDIADFRFNDNIFIRDQYYKVNKILNYDPTKEALVKVELIKTKFITIPRKFSNIKPTLPITGAVGSSVPDTKKPPKPVGGLVSSGNNVVTGGKSIVVGTDNAVYSSKSLVLGASNSVASDTKSYVLGDTNLIEGNTDKTLIIGDNNIVSEGVTGSVVFGNNNTVSASGVTLINVSGMTFTQSGMTYLGPSFSISADGNVFYNGVTFSGSQDLETTLAYGNTTGPRYIEVQSGYGLSGSVGTLVDNIIIDPSGSSTGIKQEDSASGFLSSLLFNGGITADVISGVKYTQNYQTENDISINVGDATNVSSITLVPTEIDINSTSVKLTALSGTAGFLAINSSGVIGLTTSTGGSGTSGSSGTSGAAGSSGTSGSSGSSGTSGNTGSSGTSGANGSSGTSGTSGSSGIGISGVDGASTFRFSLSGITQGINPGTGSFTIDSNTSATASLLYVNRYNVYNQDVQTWVTSLLSNYSTATVYCQVNEAGTSNQSLYEITSYGAYSGGDWFSFGLSLLGGTATYSVGNTFSIGLIRSGANGASASGASQSLEQTLAIGNTSGTYSILIASGTTASPGISFANDTDTGFRLRGGNNFAAVAGSLDMVVFANISSTPIMAMANQTTGKFYSGDGTALLPGITYESDTNTGMYRPAADTIGLASGGVTSSLFTTTGIRLIDGSAAAPSISFINDSDCGFYRVSGNIFASTNAGVRGVVFQTTATRFDLPLIALDGTAANPAYTFTNDTNTGLFLVAADTLAVSAGGLSSATFTSNGIKTADGTLALPAHSFFNDTDTGIYLPALNTLAVSTGGATSAVFTTTGIDTVDGTLDSPSISFINDTDTGMFRPISNEVTIVAGGATSASFTTQGLEINGNVGSTNSATNPSLYFDGATNTGIFYSFQHPTTNRLAISAGGATAAIFTPTTTIISSLATTPGSAERLVTVDGNGNLSATPSTPAKSYGKRFLAATTQSVTPNNNIRYVGLGFTFSMNSNSAVKVDFYFSYLYSSTAEAFNLHIAHPQNLNVLKPNSGQLFNSAAGLLVATVSQFAPATVNTPRGASIGTIITGLTAGNVYWIDLLGFSTSASATMSFRTINFSYLEI